MSYNPPEGIFRESSPSLQWTLDDKDPPAVIDVGFFRLVEYRSANGGQFIAWRATLLFWPVSLAAFVPGVALVVMGRRVARRNRLGHCPACNYNLSGLTVGSACPECGHGARSASKGEAG